MDEDDEVTTGDSRTASEFEDVLGIQVYTKERFDASKWKFLLTKSPYHDTEMSDLLKKAGVVFYRDSDHFEGAIFEKFVGMGFYTQWYLNRESEDLLKVFVDNKEVEIREVAEKYVTRKAD